MQTAMGNLNKWKNKKLTVDEIIQCDEYVVQTNDTLAKVRDNTGQDKTRIKSMFIGWFGEAWITHVSIAPIYVFF